MLLLRTYSLSWRSVPMLKSLIKIRLGALTSGSGKKKGLGTAGIIALVSLLVLIFVFYFLVIADTLASVLIPLGYDAPYFAIFNILILSMVFLLSVFETKSELFECKDNDLLLSMPIRPRDIVLARSLTVVILNVIEALVVSIPVTVMYVVRGGNPLYIPSSIISAILIALLATALSSAVGYLVALVSSRLKHSTAVTVLLSLAFIALYMVGYTSLMSGLTAMEDDPIAAGDAIGGAIGSRSVLGNISILKPIETSIFIVISLASVLLAWFIISKNYVNIITTKAEGSKEKYVHRELVAGTALIALAKKELSLFFSNATYILNGVIGALFQVMLVIMLMTSNEDLLELTAMLGIFEGDGVFELLITALLVGCGSLSSISASALSLEGKSLWIIKSSPIKTTTVIAAKLVPHLAVCLPASLVSSVLAIIALGSHPGWWAFMILVPVLSSFMFAMLGLALNIAMPKFEFASTAQVVKQSMPVLIITLGGMAFTVLAEALCFFGAMSLGAVLTAIIFSILVLLGFLAAYLILSGPSVKRLEKL